MSLTLVKNSLATFQVFYFDVLQLTSCFQVQVNKRIEKKIVNELNLLISGFMSFAQ